MTAPVLEQGATALSASSLRIGYGGKTVVDDISLTIDRREIVCLLGGSGCGKSTLLPARPDRSASWASRCLNRIRARRWCSSNRACCPG